jgi:hypothetical protein
MSVWRRGSLSKNPYRRTAFRVARVPREVARHRTIVELIGRTKRIVHTMPQEHVIDGKQVTLTEVNTAEQILLDPKQRILEELLEHAIEKPPLERVRKLAAEAAHAMSIEKTEQLPITNLTALQAWAGDLVQKFLEDAPGPDPSFGALELDIIPPFGSAGDE